MKFQTILLFAAAASFAYANSLEVSEDENAIAPNSTSDAGVSSEPETGLDEPSFPEGPEGTPSTPSGGNDSADVASGDNIPSDSTSADIPADSDSTTPSGDSDSANPSGDSDSANPSTDADVANPDGANAEAGEASDDYGETKPIDGADVADGNGEASDDYGDNKPADGAAAENNTVDSLDANDASAEPAEAGDANDAGEASADEDDSSVDGKIAAGIAGAAAVSSAGIFLWVKRSKRNELENSPLSMA